MRRTVISPGLARMIAACQLSRNCMLRVFAGLHDELPQQYSRFRPFRHPDDSRVFFYFAAYADENLMHTFTLHIDDSTSPDHLIVADLEHQSRQKT